MKLIARIFALIVSTAAAAEPIESKSIRVIDGDTIEARSMTVRLIGFDAPEIAQAKCAAERAKGYRAAERLRELVAAGNLDLSLMTCSCRPGTEGTPECNNGRSCGVLRSEGRDVGVILIREKHARRFVCGATRCPRRKSWC
jgi:endonuclease YncB( thermonuclease family)